MKKGLKITLIVFIILFLLFFSYTLIVRNASKINHTLNKIVAGEPDKSCRAADDCANKLITCSYFGCGEAVNKEWKTFCPLLKYDSSVSMDIEIICPREGLNFDVKCNNNQCEKEMINYDTECDWQVAEIMWTIDLNNHCNEDSDCKIVDGFGCPLGCYYLVKKDRDLTVYQRTIDRYYEQCPHCIWDCPSLPSQDQVKCQNNKCVDTRF